MFKIAGWAADESACGFYRIEQPFRAINEAFNEELVFAEHRLSWSGRELEEFANVVVAQRVAEAHPIAILLELTRRGTPWVYECDDDLLMLDPGNPAAGYYNSERRRSIIRTAMSNAEGLIVSTEPLAARLALETGRSWSDIEVVPNTLPDYWAGLSAKVKLDVDSPLTILWAGSATHEQDFVASGARYGVTRLLRRNDDVRMLFFGTDYSRLVGCHDATVIPWSPRIPLYHTELAYSGAHAGLCPLARTRFNDSKSWLKAIEYQAAGIIPVATDCAAYADAIEHGVTGFLCRTPVDWQRALETIANDPDRTREMRANCLALTSERLTGDHAGRWLSAISRFA